MIIVKTWSIFLLQTSLFSYRLPPPFSCLFSIKISCLFYSKMSEMPWPAFFLSVWRDGPWSGHDVVFYREMYIFWLALRQFWLITEALICNVSLKLSCLICIGMRVNLLEKHRKPLVFLNRVTSFSFLNVAGVNECSVDLLISHLHALARPSRDLWNLSFKS